MAEPPKTSEQRIDAAVQLLRPRGPGARGRSAGRAGCSHRTEGLADREPQAPTNTPNHAQPSVKPPRADSPPQAEMTRRAAPTLPSTPTVAPPPRPAQIHTARALKARERAPWCRRHQWRTRKGRPAPSTREETTVLAPRCDEPAPPPGAPKQRPHRPADPHRGFKRVSPKSRQKAGCARAPRRAVPLRGHRADSTSRRGGGGAARAPQASPQGEKALAILKSFFGLWAGDGGW